METKKLKKQGEEFKFQGGREGNLKFKDSKIQNSKETKSNYNILWLRDDDL